MLKVHRFSGLRSRPALHTFAGFTPEDVLSRIGASEKYFDQYDYFTSSGFATSRTQGIIAAYLMCNPSMTASALAAFLYVNGIPLDYEITLSTTDAQTPRTMGGDINFLTDFPNLSGFQANFNAWAAGNDEPDLPALPSAPPPEPTDYDEPDAPPQYIPSQMPPINTQPMQQPAPSAAVIPVKPTTTPGQGGGGGMAAPPSGGGSGGSVAPPKDGIPTWAFIAGGIAIYFLIQKKGKRR